MANSLYDEGAVAAMRAEKMSYGSASGVATLSDKPEGGLAQIARMLDNIEGNFRCANARVTSNLGRILSQPTPVPTGQASAPVEDSSIPSIINRLHRLTELSHEADTLSGQLAEYV